MPNMAQNPKTGIKSTLTHFVHHEDENSRLYFLSSQGNSNRKLLKAPSTGTMSSSDDFEERDSLQTFENGEPHTFDSRGGNRAYLSVPFHALMLFPQKTVPLSSSLRTSSSPAQHRPTGSGNCGDHPSAGSATPSWSAASSARR